MTATRDDTFSRWLSTYEEKPASATLELIGAVKVGKRWDVSNVKDVIEIEKFYHLPDDIREKVLNHVLPTQETKAAWSLWMRDEANNTPHYKRSGHPFPRSYKLQYTMGDKSRDVIIQEILLSDKNRPPKKTPPKKRSLTDAQKKRVAARQDFKCANKDGGISGLEGYECLLRVRDGLFDESGYEIDHVQELAVGGADILENCQALCLCCHRVKTTRFQSSRKMKA